MRLRSPIRTTGISSALGMLLARKGIKKLHRPRVDDCKSLNKPKIT